MKKGKPGESRNIMVLSGGGKGGAEKKRGVARRGLEGA